MRKKLLARIIIIIVILVVAVLSFYDPTKKPPIQIELGLDLQGGTMFVLRVQTDEAVNAETAHYAGYLRNDLKDKGIDNANVTPKREKMEIRIGTANPAHKKTLEELLNEKYDSLVWTEPERSMGEFIYTLTWNARYLKDLKKSTVKQVESSLRNRIDAIGVKEPNVTTQRDSEEEAGERIIITLPGLDDLDWAKSVIKRQAYLEWLPVLGESRQKEEEVLKQFGGQLPEGAKIFEQRVKSKEDPTKETGEVLYYCLKTDPIVTGGELKYARLGQDSYGNPAVNFFLKAGAADRFFKYTGAHKSEQLAIVLDGKVISAPVIEAQIADSGIIQGTFTRQEADTLALLLKSGSLPAKPVILQESVVGPTLGADSKAKGINAAILGLVVVVSFMIIYYKIAGIISITALTLNIILILGALAMLHAKLTLPGIAGFILTIGMAVDANVLIFERIREELNTGKTTRSAVQSGFSKAILTIFDANITTLIAGIFLFNFGTGPIKGFAIVLIIGILASLFTAIFVSKTLFLIMFKLFPKTESKSFEKFLI